jgi:hypothetical protein
MKKTFSLLASLAFAAAAQASTLSDMTYIGELNGNKYYISPDARTWGSCNALATSFGPAAHLATINSQAENDFLTSATASGPNAYGTNGIDCWIGLYQDVTAADYSEPAGGWRWTDGSSMAYMNWHPGEPNNLNENHGHFNRYPAGLWNDENENNLKRALIEVESFGFTPQLTSVCFQQGPSNNGGAIDANRSDITKAFTAQNSDVQGPINFFSLGYGGWAIFKTDRPILNGPGNDVSLIETTWGEGSYPLGESARLLASQDGNSFVDLGVTKYNGSFDFGTLSWAQYFMVVDVTPMSNSYDAYDVDGLLFTTPGDFGSSPAPDPSLGNALVAYVSGSSMQGKQKNGANVPSVRSNPTKGLNAPQLNDTYNFYSLGFGGTAVYRFGYGVIDIPGTADIQVVETSFGKPSCARYPEHVSVAVSYDGLTWFDKGILCQDGTVDVAPHTGVSFIKFTDVSDRAKFNNSADGWDLDGALNLSIGTGATPPSPCQISANRMSISETADQENVPDELQALQIYGQTAVFSLAADQVTVRITDNLGRQVTSEVVSGKIWDSVEFNLPELKSGMYIMTVESPVSRDVIKFVK